MFFNSKKSIFLQRRHVLYVLSFCDLFSLFFSSTLLAIPADEATRQLSDVGGDVKKLETLLGQGAEPQKIERFYTLPSCEVSRILLARSLDPNKYLDLVLATTTSIVCHTERDFVASCPIAISEEHMALRNELVRLGLDSGADKNRFLKIVVEQLLPPPNSLILSLIRQCDLISIALEKGARFSDIDIENIHFYSLPSPEVADLILSHSFDPDSFFNLVSRASSVTRTLDPDTLELKHVEPIPEFSAKQYRLIRLAIEKGAAFDLEKYPEVNDTLSRTESFITRSQSKIDEKLLLYIDKFPTTKTSSIAGMEKHHGFCEGITTLWLYSKWLEHVHPEMVDGCNYSWFKKTVDSIVEWDGSRELSVQGFSDLEKFASIISIFQSNQSTALESRMSSSGLYTDGKVLKKKYTLVVSTSELTANHLGNILRQIVYDGELIYVFMGGHATGLFKHGDYYYYYNPNNFGGEYKDTDINNIAAIILSAEKLDGRVGGPVGYCVSFVISSFDEQSHPYPKQEVLLTGTKVSKEAFFAATRVGSLESTKFFLDQGIGPNETHDHYKFSALHLAASCNYFDIADELLRRGANPELKMEFRGEKNVTPLMLAEKMEAPDVARLLRGLMAPVGGTSSSSVST